MNNSFSDFTAQVAVLSLDSLVDSFNAQVGNRGWTSARASHNHALIAELALRGIDISAVYDGKATSFAHHVALQGNKLVTID